MAVISTLISGLVFSYFAAQNTFRLEIKFGPYTFVDVPLYAVILISLCIGVLITYIPHLIGSLLTKYQIQKKERQVDKLEISNTDLKRQIKHLEIENKRLQKKLTPKT